MVLLFSIIDFFVNYKVRHNSSINESVNYLYVFFYELIDSI